MGYSDFPYVPCSGTVTYKCGTNPDGSDKYCEGYVLYPCSGIRHETIIPGTEPTPQLPYRYQVLRERAKVQPCCHWVPEGSEEDIDTTNPTFQMYAGSNIFEYAVAKAAEGVLPQITIIKRETDEDGEVTEVEETIDNPDRDVVGGWAHEREPSFLIVPRTFTIIDPVGNPNPVIETRCALSQAALWNQGADGSPPCNGAKTSCPFYTGKKFKYLRDEDLAPGKLVKGQMIQELRASTTDWTRYTDPETAWNNTYEHPYIWGRDILDVPTAISTESDDLDDNGGWYTYLCKIMWNFETDDAEIEEHYPSSDSSTPNEEIDGFSAPKFPTIVRNLGVATIPEVQITFPVLDYTNPINPKAEHHGFEKSSNRHYIAGLAPALSNVYIINTTVLGSNANLETMSDTELTNFIKFQILRSSTIAGGAPGFIATTSNVQRFFEAPLGIVLKHNVPNKIYVLCYRGGWVGVWFTIDYYFYHCEAIQTECNSLIPVPATDTLITRLANTTLSEEGNRALYIQLADLSYKTTVARAYQFCVFDRSYSRFILEREVPNSRFWRIDKKTYTPQGTGIEPRPGQVPNQDQAGLVWFPFDNCSRFVVRIDDPKLSAAVPAGIDRSWEPTYILFQIKTKDPITGAESVRTVEMKVKEQRGRSFDGSLMPVNFMIIEPKNQEEVVGNPPLDSVVLVYLDVYKATSEDGEDFLPYLIDLGYRDSNNYSYGGVRIVSSNTDDKFMPSSHSVSEILNDTGASTGVLECYASKYDMSYMIELASVKTGRIIGRKWIVGVPQLVHTWARDVDILYAWRSNQTFDKVVPDYHKAYFRLVPPYYMPWDLWDISGMQQYKTYVYRPKCGDHDVTFGKPGPMFSPYDDCDHSYIKVEDLGISLIYRIPYTNQSTDERYRAADLMTPAIYKHNVFGSIDSRCWFEFSLGTFLRSGAAWEGVARIRGPISPFFNSLKYLTYTSLDWRMPQFGNAGREHIRVQRTMHFSEYVYVPKGGKPQVGMGWMPAFPHIVPSSVFDRNGARHFFTNCIQQYGKKGSYIPDFTSFTVTNEGVRVPEALIKLTELYSPGTIVRDEMKDQGIPEQFNWERKTFNDIYEVHRIRDSQGRGVRWPDQGFYFNFIDPNTVWAYPEQVVEPIRDYSLIDARLETSAPFLRGVIMSKPSDPNDPQSTEFPSDLFSRPIYYGPQEIPVDKPPLRMTVVDEEYSISGVKLSDAMVYCDIRFPVYFDRFTGEIVESCPTCTGVSLADVSTISELVNFLSLKEIELPAIVPIFTPVTKVEKETLPQALDQVDTLVLPGNLLTDSTKFKIYASVVDGSPLDEDFEIEWLGFYPSATIAINPLYLPKKKLFFTPDNFIGCISYIKFNVYHGTVPSIREAQSNRWFDTRLEINLFNEQPNPAIGMMWDYYDQDDIDLGPPLPGQPDLRKGYTGPIEIDINFGYPIEVAKIAFTTYLLSKDPARSPFLFTATELDKEPSFSVILEGPSGNQTVLVDHDEIQLGGGTTGLERVFDFAYENSLTGGNSAYLPPTVTTKIKIRIGQRKDNEAFYLSPIALYGFKINSVTETFWSIEPKFMITIGHYKPDDDSRLPAQDTQYLTGIVTRGDLGDELEANGIAEFWRPPYPEEEGNYTGTYGKLRSHMAGVFKTWDTEDWDTRPSVTFYDGDPVTSEKRQYNIINTFLNDIDSAGFSQIHSEWYTYFVNPYDQSYCNSLNAGISMRFGGWFPFYNWEPAYVETDFVSATSLSPGWQDSGYKACLQKKQTIVPCVKVEGRSAYRAFYHDQGSCKGGSGAGGEVFRLFDLGLVQRSEELDMMATTGAGPTFLADNDPNSIINKLTDVNDQMGIVSRSEWYQKLAKGRYQP